VVVNPLTADLRSDANTGTDPKTLDELIREAERPGLATAMLVIMSSPPSSQWTADLLLGHLASRDWAPRGKTPKNSVAATLSRLVADGKVVRVKAGTYQIAQPGQASESAATDLEEQQRLVEEAG